MNFIKKLYTYKHDIDMHMRHHADFKIFYLNVRICTDFLKFDVRIFLNLMYGPDIRMYGFVRIFFQNLGSHPGPLCQSKKYLFCINGFS